MPVLGSSSSAGTIKRGVIIPSGWGATWRAARNASATQLAEAVILGDSTWWGQSASNQFSEGNYSPVTEIRKQAVAAGYTDAGPGVLSYYDSASQMNTSHAVDPVTVGTLGVGSAGATTNLMATYGFNINGTNSGSVQGWYNRLRLYVCALGDSGSFTYSINGGAAITITPGTGGGWQSYLITMPSGQLNTITFTGVSGNNRTDIEMFNSTGVLIHRNCVPGAQIGTFVYSADDSGNTNQLLGPICGGTQTSVALNITKATTGNWRNVSLFGLTLGVNDLTAVVSGAAASVPKYNAETFEEACNNVLAVARTCGADLFVVIPHFRVNTSGTYGKAGALLTRVLTNLALSNGAAVIDANEALGGPVALWNTADYSSGNPHLNVSGYTKIGQYVWNNLLGL